MNSIYCDELEMETRLFAPDLPEGHGVYPVLESALGRGGARRMRALPGARRMRALPGARRMRALPDGLPAFWSESFFGLDRVAIYRDSDEESRQQILIGCSGSILAETFYIEKCGMYFASKMCLLAESTQERMLYSLFAADEAVHFNWISGFATAESVREFENNPFIRLIDEVLEKEDRTTLSYIVQVILEGWGISHYHSLAANCLDPELAGVLENIIRDEARHHAGGLALFNDRRHGAEKLKRLADLLARLMSMVQAGPQMVVSQIERVRGHLSRAQKTRIFSELDCEAVTMSRIKTLKSLIRRAADSGGILDELERMGSFRAFTASECAAANR